MKTKNILAELMLFLCLYASVSRDRTNKKHCENGWFRVVDNEKNSLSLTPMVTVKDFINLRMDSDCLGNSVIIGQISKYKLDKWADETEKALGKQIAFVFNDTIISNTQVNQRLEDGVFQISVLQGSNIDLSSIYHQLRKEKLGEQIYTFYYRRVDKYSGDTLHLWRTTTNGLKSDKDYGKQPIASKAITNGEVAFDEIAGTLHLYYVEGRNCNAHFYPKNGEIIYAYMKGSQYNNLQSIANQYKELESNGLLKKASRKFFHTNQQNSIRIYLLDHIGFYPDELEYIYQNFHPLMKDMVSILLSMKRQLEPNLKIRKRSALYRLQAERI